MTRIIGRTEELAKIRRQHGEQRLQVDTVAGNLCGKHPPFSHLMDRAGGTQPDDVVNSHGTAVQSCLVAGCIIPRGPRKLCPDGNLPVPDKGKTLHPKFPRDSYSPPLQLQGHSEGPPPVGKETIDLFSEAPADRVQRKGGGRQRRVQSGDGTETGTSLQAERAAVDILPGQENAGTGRPLGGEVLHGQRQRAEQILGDSEEKRDREKDDDRGQRRSQSRGAGK